MKIILSLLGGILFNTLAGQIPAYLHYEVGDGLPGNVVYCGTQDYRGLLWFGTDKGLVCFDGTHFRAYGVAEGLPDPEVLTIKEDRTRRLWISCFKNNPCYVQNGKIVNAREDSILRMVNFDRGICQFYETGFNFWITGQNRQAILINHTEKKKIDNLPYHITKLLDTPIGLIGLNQNAVQRYDRNSKELFKIILKIKPVSGENAQCTGASISGNRVLWALNNELILLEINRDKIAIIDRLSNMGGTAFTDSAGRFWVCSAQKGAICFDNKQRDLSNPVVILEDAKVTNMFEDNQHTLWFCTFGQGIFALLKDAALLYLNDRTIPSNNITAIDTDQEGCLYAGDDEGNIYTVKGKSIQKIVSGEEGLNRTRRIIASRLQKGKVWVAVDKGLHVWQKPNRSIFIPSPATKDIYEQPNQLWLGSFNKLGYLDKTQQLVLSSTKRTTTIGADASGFLWVGRIDGLYSSADNFQYNWGEKFPILKSRIVAVQSGGGNVLWVATAEHDLLKVHLHAGNIVDIIPVNKQLSRPITNIQSLCTAPDGTLWVATNTGVYGIDRNQTITHLDKHDGLADNDVNAVVVHKETLWAATVSGLSSIKRSAQPDKSDFATYLVCLRYKNNQQTISYNLLDSLPGRHNVSLPPEARLIEFNFAGLDFRSRGSLRYEYIVRHEMPLLQYLTFSSLFNCISTYFNNNQTLTILDANNLNLGINFPSGTYHIVLTALNKSGVRSQQPDSWRFTLRPYWYQTIWFYLLIWGIVGYVAWRMFQTWAAYRRLHNEVSELQLQAIKSQINPHFIGNSINAIQQFFYPPDPTKASEYVSIFTRLLRSTMSFSEKAFITLEEELAYNTDYLKMIQLRFDDRFEFSIQGAEAFPGETLFPSMLLQPILENATVHGLAPAGKSILKINFEKIGAKLVCSISDNGIGFMESMQLKQQNQAKRESKGLALIKDKILTVNKLYKTDFQMTMEDLASLNSLEHGTRVSISYTPAHINPKYKSV